MEAELISSELPPGASSHGLNKKLNLVVSLGFKLPMDSTPYFTHWSDTNNTEKLEIREQPIRRTEDEVLGKVIQVLSLFIFDSVPLYPRRGEGRIGGLSSSFQSQK